MKGKNQNEKEARNKKYFRSRKNEKNSSKTKNEIKKRNISVQEKGGKRQGTKRKARCLEKLKRSRAKKEKKTR